MGARHGLRSRAGKGGAAALLLFAGAAAPAFAGEEELRRELEKTRAEMKALQDRVAELEGKMESGHGDGALEKAVDEYLASRGGSPVGANVSAPGMKALRLSGQVVFWWERWDGTYRPTDPAGDDVQDIGWLRTALRADADITDDLRARVEIRDSRYFGQEPATTAQLQSPGSGLDLKEGWFEADDLFGIRTKMRAGRQVLSYGDQRLVGEFDWHTYGRSFDGVLLTRTYDNTKVDVFATRIVERGNGAVIPGVDNDDRELFGIYTMTPKALHHSDLDVYVLLLNDRMSMVGEAGGMGNTHLFTAGFRLAGVKDNLDWGGEAALQRGHFAGDPASAWAAHARVGYTMSDTRWTPRIGFEWDLATGDTDPTDGTNRSFQTLFPTNHGHYGILDAMAWQNMQAFRATASLKPHRDWTVTADWWRLYLDETEDAWYSASGAPIRPGIPGASRYLGTEIDLVFTWKASDHMKVAFGGAQFFDGPFVRAGGDASDTTWVYVRFTVTF